MVGHKVPPDAEPRNPRVKDSLIYFVLPKTRRPVPMDHLTTDDLAATVKVWKGQKPAGTMVWSWKLDCFGRRVVVTQSRFRCLLGP